MSEEWATPLCDERPVSQTDSYCIHADRHSFPSVQYLLHASVFSELLIKSTESGAVRTGKHLSHMFMEYTDELEAKDISDDFFSAVAELQHEFDQFAQAMEKPGNYITTVIHPEIHSGDGVRLEQIKKAEG